MKSKAEIILNRISEKDFDHCLYLFRDTIHTINVSEYSPSQLEVWSKQKINLHEWWISTSQHIAYITKLNDKVVGFGEMTYEGELQRLYVHKDYEAIKIGAMILNKLEVDAKQLDLSNITTETSISAKPFFEVLGYEEYKQYQVRLCGIKLIKFIMKKSL